METVNKMLGQIYKELHTAKDYIDCAASMDRDYRAKYKEIASEELVHAQEIHKLRGLYINELETKQYDKINDLKVIFEYETNIIKHKILKYKTKLQLLQ